MSANIDTSPRTPPMHRLVAAIDGRIERPRISAFYLLGLMLVTGAMIMLLALYFSLIVGIVYGVYYHAINHTGILAESTDGRLVILLLCLYLMPMFAGGVVVLVMLKPFYAKRPRRNIDVVLEPERQPILFAYVERLCSVIGAPVPREIRVDCDINAAASPRRGLFSLLRGDLALTLGLPLVAHMSLRELSGVLSHEFGHFTQRLAMTLGYIVRSINHWFERIVFERDSIDMKLEDASDSENALRFFAYAARFVVWVTRGILSVFMRIGHMISCYMSRQMEYDADQYEALVAGSAAFAPTFEKIHKLSAASQLTMGSLATMWHDRKLVDNLPRLIARRRVTFNLAESPEPEDAPRPSVFDTHPADALRIECGEAIEAEGIIKADEPAEALFRNFDVICKAATHLFYQDVIGLDVRPDQLISTDEADKAQRLEEAEYEAIEKLLGQRLCASRLLTFPSADIAEHGDAAQAVKTLTSARRAMANAKQRIRKAYEDYMSTDRRVIEATQALSLQEASFSFRAKDYGLTKRDYTHIKGKCKEAVADRHKAEAVIVPFEQVTRQRILTALQLIRTPAVTSKLKNADRMFNSARRCIQTLSMMTDVFAQLPAWRADVGTLGVLVQHACEEGTVTEDNEFVILRRAEAVHDMMSESRIGLASTTYPFHHSSGKISLAEFLCPESTGMGHPMAVLDAAMGFQDRLFTLYGKLLGRIALVTLKVESVTSPQEEPQQNNANTN